MHYIFVFKNLLDKYHYLVLREDHFYIQFLKVTFYYIKNNCNLKNKKNNNYKINLKNKKQKINYKKINMIENIKI